MHKIVCKFIEKCTTALVHCIQIVNSFLIFIVDKPKKIVYHILMRNLKVVDDNGEIVCDLKATFVRKCENQDFKQAIKGEYVKSFTRLREKVLIFAKEPILLVLLEYFCFYIESGTNYIIKNNKPLTIRDTAEDLNLSRNSISKYFKRLEELEFIKKVRINYGFCYVLNPFYFLKGEKISLAVYKLFKGE